MQAQFFGTNECVSDCDSYYQGGRDKTFEVS